MASKSQVSVKVSIPSCPFILSTCKPHVMAVANPFLICFQGAIKIRVLRTTDYFMLDDSL